MMRNVLIKLNYFLLHKKFYSKIFQFFFFIEFTIKDNSIHKLIMK